MKTIAIKYTTVYKFNELKKIAQDKAVWNHAQFLCEEGYQNQIPGYFVNRAINKMEQNQTPWFLAETLYHDYRKEIEEEIRFINNDFWSDGESFYLDKHLYTGAIIETPKI